MRTVSIIAIAAALATPIAALQITNILSAPQHVAELSVQEREDQFAELSVQEREDQFAELSVQEREDQFANRAPLFDKQRDTQIG